MEPWETECPCCGCKLELEWQLATYSDGGDSPQFIDLKQIEPKTIHNPITGNDYPVHPRRVSFISRRGEQPPRRVSFNVPNTKTLSEIRCPKCNNRMRNTARRRYYCSHCKKDYKVILETIKTKIVPE